MKSSAILLAAFCLASLFVCASTHADETISARAFFSDPDMVAAQLSPDGKNIATLSLMNGHSVLMLRSADSSISRVLLDTSGFSEKTSYVRELAWIDNEIIALQMEEVRDGIKDLMDTKIARRLILIDTAGKDGNYPDIYSVRTKGWLVHALHQEKNAFLYAKSGISSKVYRIQPRKLSLDQEKLGKLDKRDGGQFTAVNEVRSVKGYAIHWYLDNTGNIFSVLIVNEKGNLELVGYNSAGKETVITTWKKQDDYADGEPIYVPIALSSDPHVYYSLDLNESEERTVYSVNFSTKKSSLAYQTSAYKIVDLITDARGELTGVKVLKDGSIVDEYIRTPGSIDRLEAISASELVSVFSTSVDGKISMTYREGHNSPGEFSLYRHSEKRHEVVGRLYPWLSDKLSGSQYEGSLEINGLDIPYLINVPAEDRVKHPLLVIPHGGPLGIFDTRYYDQVTQFFVANGMAVLRVNFRGSGGYSEALESAGKKQWGAHMLDDIHQATLHSTKRSDIDGGRICIFGISYGGYAATMLTLLHPEVYKCAVNMAGVTDMILHGNSTRYTRAQKEWLLENVGDINSDPEYFRHISPVYRAQSLKRPYLLAHGEEDKVVDVEHAYRMRMALEKHGIPFDWYIDPKAGHSLGDAEQKILFFDRALEFLKKNI